MLNGKCPFCGSSYYFTEGEKFTCFSCGATGEEQTMAVSGVLNEPGKSEILEDACRVFQKNLSTTTARAYIAERHIAKSTINSFRIGFACGNIYKELSNKYSIDELVAAGLVKSYDDGTYADVFFKRLIFPITNSNGDVVGFGGRRTFKSEKAPKYLNSRESDTFKKRQCLFGIDKIPADTQHVFLVEGYMDVCTLWQSGVHEAVAALGTAVTEQHCYLLKKRGVKRVTIALDSDVPGLTAAIRNSEILGRYFKIDFLTVEGAKDADEFLKTHSARDYYNLPVADKREFLLKHHKDLGIAPEMLPLYF